MRCKKSSLFGSLRRSTRGGHLLRSQTLGTTPRCTSHSTPGVSTTSGSSTAGTKGYGRGETLSHGTARDTAGTTNSAETTERSGQTLTSEHRSPTTRQMESDGRSSKAAGATTDGTIVATPANGNRVGRCRSQAAIVPAPSSGSTCRTTADDHRNDHAKPPSHVLVD